MLRILRLDLIVTAFVLCIIFLLCGVAGINDETSYVISGERESVIKAQSVKGKRLLATSDTDGKSETLLIVDKQTVDNILDKAKYCFAPPVGNIIWTVENIKKK